MTARLETAVAELVAALRAEMAAAPSFAPPELLDVSEAARRAGIGRTLMYQMISRGAVRSCRVGRRRLIPADALAELAQRGTAPNANGTVQEVDGHGRHQPHRSAA